MPDPTWHPHGEAHETLEENWLFQLRRQRYRSRISGKLHDYYVMQLADAVNVVALTPARKLVLVRQFRAGSGHDSLETPGGLVTAGEDPLEAAARELLEETGYAGDPPRLLGHCWSNPSILTSRITTVLITSARHVAEPKLDAEEEVHVELVPAGQLPWMIRDGRIDHALAVQGLLLWLASEIPESPLAPAFPARRDRRPQFHIRALMLAVLACAGLSWLMTLFARRVAGGLVVLMIPLVIVSIILGPLLALRVLDPATPAVLLRSYRSSPRYALFRLLAAFGLMIVLFMTSMVTFHLLL